MKLKFWLKEKTGIKRWLFLGIIGVIIIILGISRAIMIGLTDLHNIYLYTGIISFGIFCVFLSVIKGLDAVLTFINRECDNVTFDSKEIADMIYEKRFLVRGPKVVVIGGGTGLSNLLRGLKRFTSNITAIVTVADDGGGSGVLRDDLGMLPPGDIRNCILALAHTEPVMEELLQYRFTDGRLKGQSFGNLFLAAMDGISENFMEAVQKVSSVLAVTGKVLPVTLKDVTLKARLNNGNIIEGESNIPKEAIKQNSNIERVFIEPRDARALREAVLAIKDADAIIFGPGSLYTSIIPNLLVKEIKEEVHKSSAIKIYVSNLMTQKGETDDYTVKDHIKAIYNHAGKGIIDYAIVNKGTVDNDLEEKYKKKGATLVKVDKEEIEKLKIKVIEANLVKVKGGYIRHDTVRMCRIIIKTIMEKKLCYDRKTMMEYFYVLNRLRKK
ncbi:gluconeogenesis factor YvcK family protein [Hathewaya histolytica]|uniref:Putative gluconeogenesis factor n=1 Tax=Hathewaya histolytica TaxID=1498 RepID=A0A4U9QYP0_HATHI|nr:gluconeogenesis factor YvcK family protein [Hathewaya histolytica]VTQ83866.1 transporter [Hathewaya histolytica]